MLRITTALASAPVLCLLSARQPQSASIHNQMTQTDQRLLQAQKTIEDAECITRIGGAEAATKPSKKMRLTFVLSAIAVVVAVVVSTTIRHAACNPCITDAVLQ